MSNFPYPVKVIIDGEEFTPWHRLTVHPTHNRYVFVLKNKRGVTCWAPDKIDTARGIREGSLKVYTTGSHHEFIFKEKDRRTSDG